jgi:hypothetical protein
MSAEKPQLGKIEKKLSLNSRNYFLYRMSCGSCPKECGVAESTSQKYVNLASMHVCNLDDSNESVIWCGAPAMDKINV